MKSFFIIALCLAFACLIAGTVVFVKNKAKSARLVIACCTLGAVGLWLAFALCLGFFMQ